MDTTKLVETHSIVPEIDAFSTYVPLPGLGVLPLNAFLIRSAEPVLVDTLFAAVRDDFMRELRSRIALDEDLAQQVLMLTLEKLRSGAVHEPERIASFILGAARLTARGLARGARRETPAPPELLTAALGASASFVEPLPVERLERCFHALAERERTVVAELFRRTGRRAGRAST